MDPATANQAVQTRAQQIMSGASAPALEQPGVPLPAGPAQPPGAAPQQIAAPPAAPPVSPQQSGPQPQFFKMGPGGQQFVTTGLPPGYALARMPDGSNGAAPIPGFSAGVEIKDVGGVRSIIDKRTGQVIRTEALPPTLSRVQTTNPDGSHTLYNTDGSVRMTSPPNSRDVQVNDYEADRKEVNGIADAGQQAQSNQIRIQTMRDALNGLSTGSGGTSRATMATFAQTYFPDKAATFVKNITGMSDPEAAQEFSKLALASAGSQERGVLGSRGGYQAIRLFQASNPSLDLLPNANKAILGAQLIGAQADADYAQGALAHFNQNADGFRSGRGAYQPLTNFDQQWQAQRNPQVYAAAMSALAGQPFEKWSKGLSPAEGQRVGGIIARADPQAQIPGRGGMIPATNFLAPR